MNLSGIIPACVTPFVDGRADPTAMQHNIARWLALGVDGLLVFGSTGEFAYLEDDERRAVLQAARSAVPSDRLLLAGCSAESTQRTLRYLGEAAADGADAALVVTPVYYTRGNAESQRKYYLTLADASPLPILLYTVSAFTMYALPVDLILELARHPNIVGIKDSTGDLARVALQLQAGLPDFAIFSGSPHLVFPALAMGAAGSITALANIVPEIIIAIADAVRANDARRAGELQGIVTQLHGQIGRFGIPGIKAVLAHRGFVPGEPRPPLLPLAESDAAKAVAVWEQTMARLAR